MEILLTIICLGVLGLIIADQIHGILQGKPKGTWKKWSTWSLSEKPLW